MDHKAMLKFIERLAARAAEAHAAEEALAFAKAAHEAAATYATIIHTDMDMKREGYVQKDRSDG